MCKKIYTVLLVISPTTQSIAVQNGLFLNRSFFDMLWAIWDIELNRPMSLLERQMSQATQRFSALKVVFEIACAAVGFAMGLLFAKQLDLGIVPGVFMGLMGAIFTFILAQGLTSFIFRILRRD